jgi:MoxR-like ATPase
VDETEILRRTTGRAAAAARPVLSGQDVLAAQALTREVSISEDLLDYVTRLVRATRPDDSASTYVREWTRWGAGPRAGQALVLASKARAVLHGRLAVTLPDLRAVALPVLRHRILVNFRAEAEGVSSDAVTARLLDEVDEPQSPLR